jgi:hypothetical protein
MSGPPAQVIDRARAREVTGIFHSRAALDEAIEALLLAGFDRADIDILDDPEAIRARLGPVYIAPEELADVPLAPRRPAFLPEDIAAAKVVAIPTVAAFAATVAAFWALSTGDGIFWTVIYSVLAAAAAGGAAALMIRPVLERERAFGLEHHMLGRGIVLWIRVHSPEQEQKALEILREFAARAVRVHEVDIEKRVDDIPMSSQRPDPWLGPERLGDP